MAIATAILLTIGPAGMLLGVIGHRRAFQERDAGYTTLRGNDDSLVQLRASYSLDSWEAFGTDHLWHLDPATGTVIRPPLDPVVTLRDGRIRPPLRRIFGPRS